MKRIINITWVLLIAVSVQIFAQDVGEKAPNFQASLLGGESFNLADHEGKVVMVFFFGNIVAYAKKLVGVGWQFNA